MPARGHGVPSPTQLVHPRSDLTGRPLQLSRCAELCRAARGGLSGPFPKLDKPWDDAHCKMLDSEPAVGLPAWGQAPPARAAPAVLLAQLLTTLPLQCGAVPEYRHAGPKQGLALEQFVKSREVGFFCHNGLFNKASFPSS